MGDRTARLRNSLLYNTRYKLQLSVCVSECALRERLLRCRLLPACCCSHPQV
jgi:hypothetical protein